jgi:hypothetical protein
MSEQFLNLQFDEYQKFMRQKSLDEFQIFFSKINHSQQLMEKIGFDNVYYDRKQFIEIMVKDNKFIITDNFINLVAGVIRLDMIQLINNLTNINVIEKMTPESLYKMIIHILASNDLELVDIFFNSKIYISNITADISILRYTTKSNCHILKYLLTNGLKINIKENDLTELARIEPINIEILISHGFNFDIFNETAKIEKFNTMYQLLINANINPKTIAYAYWSNDILISDFVP